MTLIQWFIFFLILQVIHFAGTWKLYVRAGRKAWEAAVPVYNAVVLMKIINRPVWWVILLFIPIVNLIMFPVIWTETARSFGFNTYKDTALVVLTFGLYLFYINYATDAPYIEKRDLMPKSTNGEWVSSILFAIVAATLVHTYFMQPFTIPSSSLEKTLLVGDYLFVSKFHYGARTPITTVAAPMLHDSLPVVKSKSYLKWPQLPYYRLPGFQKIKKNDIVVFSWPVDTLVDIRPGHMRGSVRKPIDKKSNYVKRAVGMPGDSLEVRDGYVYINGKKNDLPDRARIQFSYLVQTNETINPRVFVERYDITDGVQQIDGGYFIAAATEEAIEKLRNRQGIGEITKYNSSPSGKAEKGTFPESSLHPNNRDFFGPIYIPAKGATVDINPTSLPFYKRIIEVYEGYEMGRERDITVNGTQVLLNGEPLNDYTFEQDYYWLMGDNRHNSQDARAWGYVPFNHVVGKPVFVWFSLDPNQKGLFNSIRWDRVFTTVGGEGKPTSYLLYFLVAVGLYFGWSAFSKRKKKSPKK